MYDTHTHTHTHTHSHSHRQTHTHGHSQTHTHTWTLTDTNTHRQTQTHTSDLPIVPQTHKALQKHDTTPTQGEWTVLSSLSGDCSSTLHYLVSHPKSDHVRKLRPQANDHVSCFSLLRSDHCFSLLRSAIQCIRGSRSRDGRPQSETISRGSPNAELVTVEAGLSIQLN